MSYLIESPVLGRYSLNFVRNIHNGRSSQPLNINQQVISFTVQKMTTALLKNNTTTIETELSRFKGDHYPARACRDKGLYLQIDGKHNNLPLTYKARYEKYGQNYKPEGVGVSADRKSYELHIGYRLINGLQINSRIQNFYDSYESSNPSKTNASGITLSGPILPHIVKELSGNLDLSFQEMTNRDKTTDSIVKSCSLNLNKPINPKFNTQLGLFYQDSDNKVVGSFDSITKQLNIGTNHPIKWNGFEGSMGPGITIRKITGSSKSTDLNYSLSLNMNKGPHNVGYNIGYNTQDRKTASEDVSTLSNNISYRYTMKKDVFSLNLSSENRNSRSGNDTVSYRGGLSWNHSFDRTIRPGCKVCKEERIKKEKKVKSIEKFVHLDLLQLTLLSDKEEIEEKLK
ncbi:MAG: hypothetical protein AB1567_01845 [bacterium]